MCVCVRERERERARASAPMPVLQIAFAFSLSPENNRVIIDCIALFLKLNFDYIALAFHLLFTTAK